MPRSFAATSGNSFRRFHGNLEQLYSAAIWSVTQGSVSLVRMIIVCQSRGNSGVAIIFFTTQVLEVQQKRIDDELKAYRSADTTDRKKSFR